MRPWELDLLIADAMLLISELVTNALRYGEGGTIEFRLVITCRGILITVNDGSARRPHLRMVGASNETGRGLVIVRAIADAWGVSSDGTTTWCTLSLAGQAAEAGRPLRAFPKQTRQSGHRPPP